LNLVGIRDYDDDMDSDQLVNQAIYAPMNIDNYIKEDIIQNDSGNNEFRADSSMFFKKEEKSIPSVPVSSV